MVSIPLIQREQNICYWEFNFSYQLSKENCRYITYNLLLDSSYCSSYSSHFLVIYFYNGVDGGIKSVWEASEKGTNIGKLHFGQLNKIRVLVCEKQWGLIFDSLDVSEPRLFGPPQSRLHPREVTQFHRRPRDLHGVAWTGTRHGTRPHCGWWIRTHDYCPALRLREDTGSLVELPDFGESADWFYCHRLGMLLKLWLLWGPSWVNFERRVQLGLNTNREGGGQQVWPDSSIIWFYCFTGPWNSHGMDS